MRVSLGGSQSYFLLNFSHILNEKKTAGIIPRF